MERAICEQCGHSQPREWVAGHLCVACGAAVRRDYYLAQAATGARFWVYRELEAPEGWFLHGLFG